MTNARKFLFDTSFDLEVRRPQPHRPEPELEAPPPPPSFSEEELQATRDAAFRAGWEEGSAQAQAEARRSAEAAGTRALALIGDSLRQALERLDERREAAMVQALDGAVAVLRKLFPLLSERHGLGEIEGLVRNCLERLHEEPRVVVRAPDALLDALRLRLDELKLEAAYEGRVVLLADDELGPGDARIEWADGGAERSGRLLWGEIEEILSHALAATEATAPTDTRLDLEAEPRASAPDTEASAERPAQPAS